MNYVVIANKYSSELQKIRQSADRQIAFVSDDDCEWNLFTDVARAEEFADSGSAVDFACLDATMQNGIGLCEKMRKNNMSAFLLLVADITLSPTEYIRPTIMPGGLLLRPFTDTQLDATMRSGWLSIRNNTADNSEVFSFVSKNEHISIPYNRIAYFEAREKKVFLNTGNREYAVYDTIDNLETSLPENFLRCHRSFIVNRALISNICISASYIEMESGACVPLSRSYKSVFKENRK